MNRPDTEYRMWRMRTETNSSFKFGRTASRYAYIGLTLTHDLMAATVDKDEFDAAVREVGVT
jgi:hypothetical protein